ncbi:MAG: hypothetical protein Q8O74_09970, partial [bacterium]|nr:hypothetical protein [bacterium]
TKSAIVLFNKNKDLTSVLKIIPENVIKHPNYKRTLNDQGETLFKYILGHPDDSNREIILSILVFNIPSS